MASFGRLAASVITGSVENTATLLNLNFDFSLVKLEAPKEFEGVGFALSLKRRVEAEEGRTHSTARKLAALFKPVLPQTPELLKAYGNRASEISQSPLAKPADAKMAGLFAHHVGADCTSLWAAATSRPSAIHIHLLACMLARMWSHPQATSIWVEFVEIQKKKTISQFIDSSPILASEFLAARQEITREQLAEWDSSARAWMVTADAVKKKQQTQLDLILKNIEIPVNNKLSVYDGVLQTWVTALEGLERLICGMPQLLQSGEILLGLYSWHIYPDLLVLGVKDTRVKQEDILVKASGLLTLGLQGYYREPVVTTRTTTEGSRLTMDEFLQGVLGAMIGRILPDSDDFSSTKRIDSKTVELLANYLVEISEYFFDADTLGLIGRENWLSMLTEAGQLFLKSEGIERQKNLSLINLGNRNAWRFLPPTKLTLLGLSDFSYLLALCENLETRLKLLRQLAQENDEPSSNWIISYKHECNCGASFYEYATAVPSRRSSFKRRINGPLASVATHIRWIYPTIPHEDSHRYTALCKWTLDPIPPDSEVVYLDPSTATSKKFKVGLKYNELPLPIRQVMGKQRDSLTLKRVTGILDEIQLLHSTDPIPTYRAWSRPQPPPPPIIRVVKTIDTIMDITTKVKNRIDYQLNLFRTGVIDKSRFRSMFAFILMDKTYQDNVHSSLGGFLKAVHAVSTIYKNHPMATIDGEIFQTQLLKYGWLASSLRKYQSSLEVQPNLLGHVGREEKMRTIRTLFGRFSFNLKETFACICSMENAKFDLYLKELDKVMAISARDSIYVASPLVSDPFFHRTETKVIRIMGNVGKSGISLLIPPGELRKPTTKNIGNWKLINHFPFEGEFRDYFAGTSLHLSLTGGIQPVNVGAYGVFDSEINFVESVVSVLDRGEWVADIDVLRTWSVDTWEHRSCDKTQHQRENHEIGHYLQHEDGDIITIQNWSELFARPEGNAIFLAKGNWQARLAASIVLTNLDTSDKIVIYSVACALCLRTHGVRKELNAPQTLVSRSQSPVTQQSYIFIC
ncbi:hypothetical protein H072_1036 [Dactylellina haptotyla CBS 200.50]|uniref:Uncharacterized protein n=1 Tax=Dactylellina haptotyla (strain CBS 200.50) TaxID=1284197 RepID=S8AQ67_DACHA|nr:hypothetical protein H072_1036 [Dactylellina haptotyla CBS 200.50]